MSVVSTASIFIMLIIWGMCIAVGCAVSIWVVKTAINNSDMIKELKDIRGVLEEIKINQAEMMYENEEE